MKDVTMTFTCAPNEATLLLCFYGVITHKVDEPEEMQDSIPVLEHWQWMFDEMLERLPFLVWWDETEAERKVPPLYKQLAEMRENRQRVLGEEKQGKE